jgi:hypothetical protein
VFYAHGQSRDLDGTIAFPWRRIRHCGHVPLTTSGTGHAPQVLSAQMSSSTPGFPPHHLVHHHIHRQNLVLSWLVPTSRNFVYAGSVLPRISSACRRKLHSSRSPRQPKDLRACSAAPRRGPSAGYLLLPRQLDSSTMACHMVCPRLMQ